MTQLTIGFLLGLLIGLPLRQLRPLVIVLLALTAASAAYAIHIDGLPGFVRLLEQIAAETRVCSAFFAAMAVGKLVGGALAGQR